MITIVNFDMGNIGSIKNMCKKVGLEAEITSDPIGIQNAEKLILPGVGAFDKAMSNLHEMRLVEVLNEMVIDEQIPVIGICLGMQLLTERSEEGEMDGLGWIEGNTKHFNLEHQDLRVPHMGWNHVNLQKDHQLFEEMYEDPRFYFVHSYYVEPKHEEDILTTTNYGIEFTSSVVNNNIMGVQFHPEKSHKYGMRIFENFGEI